MQVKNPRVRKKRGEKARGVKKARSEKMGVRLSARLMMMGARVVESCDNFLE